MVKLIKSFGSKVLVKLCKSKGVKFIETDNNYVMVVSKRYANKQVKKFGFDLGIHPGLGDKG